MRHISLRSRVRGYAQESHSNLALNSRTKTGDRVPKENLIPRIPS